MKVLYLLQVRYNFLSSKLNDLNFKCGPLEYDNLIAFCLFSVNCWPSENGDGGCDVNIEYELEHTDLELNNVQISIPLPSGCTPVVGECDGQYSHEARRNTLLWSLPLVDASTKSGSMEFSAPHSNPSDFFPLRVMFTAKTSYAKIKANICSILMSFFKLLNYKKTCFVILICVQIVTGQRCVPR